MPHDRSLTSLYFSSLPRERSPSRSLTNPLFLRLCDRSFKPLSNVNAKFFGVINQMKTIKNLSIAVIGTAIFLLQYGNTQAATIIFSDSTFNNDDWEVTPFIQGSSGAIDANQITSSDNQFRLNLP